MLSRPPTRELCAAGARRVGEPLFATASRVDLWLVLEVPGPWAREVGDTLAPETAPGRALLPVLRAVPRSRVLFIKGGERGRRETLRFFLAVTDEAEPRLYRFELPSYEALEQIDLFEVLAESRESFRDDQPLYLVCTHGTHDRCCAKFGFPLYRTLAGQLPERVWQTSHVGGDRFAANVVCLPDGLYYGHVEPGDTEGILESTAHGRLYLPRWRGRTCYAPPVQAAEYFLREAQGETSLSAYRFWSQRKHGEATEATFLETRTDRRHILRVEPAQREGTRFLTCGTVDEKPVASYRLVDLHASSFTPEIRTAAGGEYSLRPAAMRDYGLIYRLRRDTLRGYLDELQIPPEEQPSFFARFDVARHRLVCVSEGAHVTPAGAVAAWEREDGLHLANLHFLPAYQGRGLGTAVVRELQQQAASRGRRMTTQVLKVNPARAFYERLGFRIEGEQGLRYRMAWEP